MIDPASKFRSTLDKILPLLIALTTPLMLWKGLCTLTRSSTPVVCVVSESMAPAFHRGDILFLWNRSAPIHVGDIPVVWFAGNPLPMVHRAVEVFTMEYEQSGSTRQLFVTKGDNNDFSDVSLYPGNRQYVERAEVLGLVKAYVPWIGWIVIGLQELSWMKYLVLGIFSLLGLIESRD